MRLEVKIFCLKPKSQRSISPATAGRSSSGKWEANHIMLAAPNGQNLPKHRPFIIPIFLPHAGCPHQCVFCNQVSITGTKHVAVNQNEIRTHIRRFLKYKSQGRKPVELAFFGGNFLGLEPQDLKSCLAVAKEFISRGVIDGIRFSTRPDTIDARRLDMLDDLPVSMVELGVQSMDDQVLALAERGHNAADSIRAVQALKRRKLGVAIQMMVGLPGDTEARSLATAHRIVALEPDCVRIYPTVVVENSGLARWFNQGKYHPLPLETAVTLVKKIYLIFKKEDIAVIRMGLQATEDLDNGSLVLAGPHHPAFGHMVYSEIFYDRAVREIESAGFTSDRLSIYVYPGCISRMRGLGNSNIKKLKEQFGFYSIDVRPDDSLGNDELNIEY